MAIAIGLLVLGGIVFLHELGHFAAAKLLNVPAPVFSIGFGPALFQWTFRGTNYRLAAIPLGGYVLFGDADNLDAVSPLKRILIFLAGPAANFLTALAIFWDPWLFGAQLGAVLEVVAQLFTGRVGIDELAGPVGIVSFAGQKVSMGLEEFLGFVAFLSINLGVLNLLPLPILDGGQILIAAFEGISRRRMHLKVRVAMALVCWILFFVLVAVVTFNDITRSRHEATAERSTNQSTHLIRDRT